VQSVVVISISIQQSTNQQLVHAQY